MKHGHSRRCPLPFAWPDPPLRLVLVEPEIPPNTGNIARTCAATGTQLPEIIHEPVSLIHFDLFLETTGHPRLWLFTTGATRSLYDADFQPGDALVFGSETRGLSDTLLARYPERAIGIPLRSDHVRSLNLSTAAGIALYEALRKISAQKDLTNC